MSFAEAWERIKNSTPLKTLNDLAGLIQTSQPNVSRRKKEKNFPAEWAYAVGKKYGIFTEWIMTGEGPKNLSDFQQEKEDFLTGYIAEWIKEQTGKDPDFNQNFQTDCALAFPDFAEWLKKRKAVMVSGSSARRKVS